MLFSWIVGGFVVKSCFSINSYLIELHQISAAMWIINSHFKFIIDIIPWCWCNNLEGHGQINHIDTTTVSITKTNPMKNTTIYIFDVFSVGALGSCHFQSQNNLHLTQGLTCFLSLVSYWLHNNCTANCRHFIVAIYCFILLPCFWLKLHDFLPCSWCIP